MSELKLLPCPFCGGEATVGANEYYDGANTFYTYCTNCGVQQITTKIRTDEAISAWNRRAEPENEPLTLDELRGMDGEPVWTEAGSPSAKVEQATACWLAEREIETKLRGDELLS